MGPDPGATVVADRYVLGPLLGRGGMGVVRLARDQRLTRDVAVKLLDHGTRVGAEALARFEYEARAAAAVEHANVVAVYDYGDDGERVYLVMEALTGRTLHDEIEHGPLQPRRVVEVARDVLAGLGAAHQRGIVHRDVKPGNVLFDERGRAKIGDFGVATSGTSDLTQAGIVLGTPAYLAPERLAGHPATARSDLYAVGVVCYEALAGEKPFGGNDPIALSLAIEHGHAPHLRERAPDVPGELSDVVMRALERDPLERFATAEAFADALRYALYGIGESTDEVAALAPPTQAVPRVGPPALATQAVRAIPADIVPSRAPSRRFPAIAFAVAAAAIAAVVALVVYAQSSNTNGTPSTTIGRPPTTVTIAPTTLATTVPTTQPPTTTTVPPTTTTAPPTTTTTIPPTTTTIPRTTTSLPVATTAP
ncbi:MAG: Serine/threonine-protein kinase PrkC [Actinomycetia bacterium]|nr:Serine/threonine-protein kinase PrkC [Actinomycetes bacterium]